LLVTYFFKKKIDNLVEDKKGEIENDLIEDNDNGMYDLNYLDIKKVNSTNQH